MIMSIFSNKLLLYIIIASSVVFFFMVFSLYQRKQCKITYIPLIEQSTSFECGFDRFDKEYLGFCVQYIKTAFLFLIVDLEIALVIPLFMNTPLYEKSYLSSLTILLLIIIALLLMLFMEVLMGGLSWQEDL